MSRHLHLRSHCFSAVGQVCIQLYIHGHVRCDILRTLSTIAQSVIVSSSSDCISECIIVSKSIVDGLIDKHREQVFPNSKDESIESIDNDKQTSREKHTVACTLKSLKLDRASGYLRRYTKLYSRGRAL